jgi:DNA-binding NarL/FixJ family response regulator
MIVEDQAGFRRLLAAMLDRQDGLEVVAKAESLQTARELASHAAFDVVLLDLNLPDGKGWDLIAELREVNPGVGVLVLSASFDAENLAAANGAGADAILDKFAAPKEIVDAVSIAASRRPGASPSDPG